MLIISNSTSLYSDEEISILADNILQLGPAETLIANSFDRIWGSRMTRGGRVWALWAPFLPFGDGQGGQLRRQLIEAGGEKEGEVSWGWHGGTILRFRSWGGGRCSARGVKLGQKREMEMLCPLLLTPSLNFETPEENVWSLSLPPIFQGDKISMVPHSLCLSQSFLPHSLWLPSTTPEFWPTADDRWQDDHHGQGTYGARHFGRDRPA